MVRTKSRNCSVTTMELLAWTWTDTHTHIKYFFKAAKKDKRLKLSPPLKYIKINAHGEISKPIRRN